MNRRRFLTATLSLWLVSLAPLAALAAAEPTYTVTLPGDQVVHLQIRDSAGGDGVRTLRVWNRPNSEAKSVIQADIRTTLDKDGQPDSTRIFFGLDAGMGLSLEAIRSGGVYKVQEPGGQGDLSFGAPLFSPMVAELFLGRQYDFKKGGPQNFAHLIDYGTGTAKIDTLTLTAGGEERITLPDGPVDARRMSFHIEEALLPEAARSGVFYVGPSGEVLKCDTPLFGVPLRAKGPATLSADGKRMTLRFQNPDSGDNIVTLRADKIFNGDWLVTLEFEKGSVPIATATCDGQYQLKRLDTPWHNGRKFTATAAGSTVHWTLAPGSSDSAPFPMDKPVWFVSHWFFTSVWEGAGGRFSSLAVGDTAEGFYFPLFTGQRDGDPFTLERLPDTPVKRGAAADAPLRHYRFYAGGKTPDEAQTARLKAQGRTLDARYDLYTDGSRLVVFLTGDGIRIVRDGWESFAGALPAPEK